MADLDLEKEAPINAPGHATSKELPPAYSYDTADPAPPCAVPMECSTANLDEVALTSAQRAAARSLTCRGSLLLVLTVVSMITPAIWIVVPIDSVLNITVASLVIHWTQPHNARRIPKMPGRCCGFRHVYGLSIAAAVVTAVCLLLRLITSVALIDQLFDSGLLGVYYLVSAWSSLCCVLLLSLIASDSAPTTGYVSLTRPEGALISKRRQERDTFDGEPPSCCCSLAVARAVCCVAFAASLALSLLAVLVFARFASRGYGRYENTRYLTCRMDAVPSAVANCSCLDPLGAATMGLLCTAQSDPQVCVSSDRLLCPSAFAVDSSRSLDSAELQMLWRPTCLVAPSCAAIDSTPDRLGLRSRPCQVVAQNCTFSSY